jgi:DNA mismatch repair protein MutS
LSLFISDPCKQTKDDPLQEALAEIDPDSLTPREALEQLYRLKELSGD